MPGLDPAHQSEVAEEPEGRARRFAIRLGLISAAAMALRLWLLRSVASRNPDGGDPLYYHIQAKFLVDGHGFSDPFLWMETGQFEPVAIHPPLFTIWLAIPTFFGFDSFLAHKIMSCLAGALAVAAIGLFAREAAGDRAGLLAAGIAAVYPPLWSIDGQLWPEGLFTAFVALAGWAGLRAHRSHGWRWAAAAGALVALAALTRGEAIALAPLMVAPLLWFRREVEWRVRLRDLTVAGVACLVLLAPWMIRNLTTFEHFVPLSTNSDEVLVYANNPYAYGTADGGRFLGFWFYPWQDELRALDGEPPGDASEKARHWGEEGMSYARDNLDRLPVVVAARVGRAWNLYAPFQNASFDQIDGKNRSVSVAGVWSWWAVLAGAVAGAVVLRRRGQTLIPYVALAATVTITAIYAYGANRFRTPLEAGAIVLAAVALDALIHRRTRTSR